MSAMTTKRTARTMSSFGQFQMGKSHIKTNLDAVIPKPRATDMAEALRSGKTLEQVGEEFDLAPATVRSRLASGGWSSNGEPRRAKK
jgi:DNA-binding NarL/FixJ family response regulator